MKVPMWLLWASAVGPPMMASLVLTLTMTVLLPPAIGLLVFVVGVVSLVALGAGWPAGLADRVLTWSRAATAAELVVLAPVAAQLRDQGLPVGAVFVRRTAGRPTAPTEVVGRDSVVVTTGLIEHLYRGDVSIAEGTAVAAHAVGRHRAERIRYEYAVRASLLPWQAVSALGRGVAGSFAWLPFTHLAWTLRGVVGVVCVVQSAAEGRPLVGVLAGSLVALTYLVPAEAQARHCRIETDADDFVVGLGLGGDLVDLLRRSQHQLSVARAQRLQTSSWDNHLKAVADDPVDPSTRAVPLRS
jgi:hypothetical protein